jgi:hypothetical protein
MTTLKLKHYFNLEGNLTELVKIFNAIKLNDVAAQYIDGLPITEVDAATVLTQYNYDRASTLPSFAEYRALGIDLSQSMPFDPETKDCLSELETAVDEFLTGQYGSQLQYLSYSKKLRQYEVNQRGKEALQRLITTLTGKDEELYNAVLTLNKLMREINPFHSWHLLSEDVIHPFTKDLSIDSVVYNIKKQSDNR